MRYASSRMSASVATSFLARPTPSSSADRAGLGDFDIAAIARAVTS